MISGLDCLNMWAVAWMKWPDCGKSWMEHQGYAIEGALGVSAGAPKPARTGEDFHALSTQVAHAMHGRKMEFMHAQISTKLMMCVMFK